jgi:hypothetical protein
VAEQLALGNRDRQRGAVHMNERLVAPPRSRVDMMRDQLLADSRFAGDEHGQVRCRDQLNLTAQGADGRADAENLAAAGQRRRAQQILGHAFAMRRRALERFDERCGAERRTGECAERGHHVRIEIVEAAGLEPIGGERAHRLTPRTIIGKRICSSFAMGAQASGPVHVMEVGHEHHREHLLRLRALTNNLTPPNIACTTWRALYAGLEQLEQDLMNHIHLENNVLFPRALAG